MSDLVICDGVLLKSSELRLSPFDLGLTVGDGVFETLLVQSREVFAFSRHFSRMQNSAALLGLEVPAQTILREQASVLLHASGIERGRLRITLSAGAPETGFARKTKNQRFLITITEISKKRAEPATVIVSETRRFSDAISSRAKTLSYGENVWALRAGQAQGADEVLLANERGELCEAAMANVFFWIEGAWHTPPLTSGCLPGITRALVDQILTANGENCRHKSLFLNDLGEIEEMVLTSSLTGVRPVANLAGRDLSIEKGEKLSARYEGLVTAEIDP